MSCESIVRRSPITLAFQKVNSSIFLNAKQFNIYYQKMKNQFQTTYVFDIVYLCQISKSIKFWWTLKNTPSLYDYFCVNFNQDKTNELSTYTLYTILLDSNLQAIISIVIKGTQWAFRRKPDVNTRTHQTVNKKQVRSVQVSLRSFTHQFGILFSIAAYLYLY